ncbi:hypothetical protein P4679_25530 [Priestia megaterium]|uniref:hypothetical protein n=1 Tax=Priestia megaterium TaxID=1404 RepID=UPI002E2489E7|nr:hypothetical protein [Priestia megaterium]
MDYFSRHRFFVTLISFIYDPYFDKREGNDERGQLIKGKAAGVANQYVTLYLMFLMVVFFLFKFNSLQLVTLISIGTAVKAISQTLAINKYRNEL